MRRHQGYSYSPRRYAKLRRSGLSDRPVTSIPPEKGPLLRQFRDVRPFSLSGKSSVRVRRHSGAFAGLDEDEALALVGQLHGLAAAAADQGAGLEGAVDADLEAGAPRDGGLAVGEGRG